MEDVPQEFELLLHHVPELPTIPQVIASGTVQASAVASGIDCAGQLDIPWPFYLITTRDCFKYNLIEVKKRVAPSAFA